MLLSKKASCSAIWYKQYFQMKICYSGTYKGKRPNFATNLTNLCHKLKKIGHNFGPKRPNFGHIRIFPAYRIWFSQRTPQDLFPYKKLWKFIAAFGRYRPKRPKNGYFGQKWPNFDPFWPIMAKFEFSTKNEKWRILGILDVQLHEKNQKKI